MKNMKRKTNKKCQNPLNYFWKPLKIERDGQEIQLIFEGGKKIKVKNVNIKKYKGEWRLEVKEQKTTIIYDSKGRIIEKLLYSGKIIERM